jgi:hypothetical protein
LASFSQIADRRPAPPPPTPRNAPCPCGSHLKFKHCCGKLAPPVLHMGARQPKS